MAAFTPKADIDWRLSHVRFVPEADATLYGAQLVRDCFPQVTNFVISLGESPLEPSDILEQPRGG